MLRTLDVVMIGLLLGGTAFTFKIKQDSEAAIERVQQLERRIAAEREAIDVLRADWSLLNDPRRLQKLAERYGEQLGLEPLKPEQIGSFEDIPERPPSLPREGAAAIADLIEGGDGILTGAVDENPMNAEAAE